ncbi:hypothetical protein ACFRFH_18065 [Leifsonia sp. NPDC056824]|uniref:hypothetical protein n=1 Tax=Leifsonia sp. NPDC056824 TaxID=3345953 RepID=UPI0036B1E0E5
MEPTTAFVMALLALTVSLIAAVASVTTLTRSIIYRARPQLEFDIRSTLRVLDSGLHESRQVRAVNHGMGVMRDVEWWGVHQYSGNGGRVLSRKTTLEQGEAISASVEVTPNSKWKSDMYFELRWRSEPDFRKIKSRALLPD